MDSFWLFDVPNLIMAMAMYSILGRFVLSLIFPIGSDVVIVRVFEQVTDPFVKPVRAITPLIVPERVIFLFAFLWLFALRIALYILARMYGFAPSIVG
ncbi:MAG: hypothetical protein ACFCUN_00215 [Hyphomicrobiaceae bacterium]